MISLTEALTKEQLLDIFGPFYGRDRVNSILSALEEGIHDFLPSIVEYSNHNYYYDINENDVKLKLTLVMKLLSLFKKEYKDSNDAYEMLMKFLNDEIGGSNMITVIYMMSYVINNSNIINNLKEVAKEYFKKFLEIQNIRELFQWKSSSYWPGIMATTSEAILDHILAKKAETVPIWEDENWKAYKFDNHQIARKVGGDTKWCVSSPTSGKDHFYEYTEEGNFELYAIVNKEDPKEKYLLAVKQEDDYDIEHEPLLDLADITNNDIHNIVNEFWATVERLTISNYDNSKFDELFSLIEKFSITDDEFYQIFLNKFEKFFIHIRDSYVAGFRDTIEKSFISTLSELLGEKEENNLLTKIHNDIGLIMDLSTADEDLDETLLNEIDKIYTKYRREIENKRLLVAGVPIGIDPEQHENVFVEYTYELKDRNNEDLSSDDEEEILRVFAKINASLKSFFLDYKEQFMKYQEAIENYEKIWNKIEDVEERKFDRIIRNMKKTLNMTNLEVFKEANKINKHILNGILNRGKEAFFYNTFLPIIDKYERQMKEILRHQVTLGLIKKSINQAEIEKIDPKEPLTHIKIINDLLILLKEVYNELVNEGKHE